jgi:hypothetical protein
MPTSLHARIRAKLGATNKRLFAALGCYAILLAAALYALLPAHTSDERFLLGIVLLIFAILTVKTIAQSREKFP